MRIVPHRPRREPSHLPGGSGCHRAAHARGDRRQGARPSSPGRAGDRHRGQGGAQGASGWPGARVASPSAMPPSRSWPRPTIVPRPATPCPPTRGRSCTRPGRPFSKVCGICSGSTTTTSRKTSCPTTSPKTCKRPPTGMWCTTPAAICSSRTPESPCRSGRCRFVTTCARGPGHGRERSFSSRPPLWQGQITDRYLHRAVH